MHQFDQSEHEFKELTAYMVRRFGPARALLPLFLGLEVGMEWWIERADQATIATEGTKLALALGCRPQDAVAVGITIAKAIAHEHTLGEVAGMVAEMLQALHERYDAEQATPENPADDSTPVDIDPEPPADPEFVSVQVSPELAPPANPEPTADPAAKTAKRRTKTADAEPAPPPVIASPDSAEPTLSVHVVDSAELAEPAS